VDKVESRGLKAIHGYSQSMKQFLLLLFR